MSGSFSQPGAAEGPGSLMAAEIDEQPEVLARLLAARAEIVKVATALRERHPRFVVLTARGTSDNAALYGKYLAEIALGMPAGLASPSTMTLYGARPDMSGVLFLAVSQSGSSPDLVDSVTVARAGGAVTVAISNDPDSPLAEAAEFQVSVGAGVERAVAATKTYTAELLALYLLLTALRDASRWAEAGLFRLPEAARQTVLRAFDRADEMAARFRHTDRLVITGRGYGYPTALEGALKLMETSYVSAHGFSAADLMHGPLALVGPEVPVVAVATPGTAGKAIQPALRRLSEAGAQVTLVGPESGLPVATEGIEEALHAILQILPLQRFALGMALHRGMDPDRPRRLTKITRTW